VSVKLVVFERDAMPERIDDVRPEDLQALEKTVHRAFNRPFEAALEVQEAQIEMGEAAIARVETDRQRKDLQERLARQVKDYEEMKETVNRMRWQVIPRDYGDDCYMILLDGGFPKNRGRETRSISAYNACLRNGNAVVHITLAAQRYPGDALRAELDRFLCELDARTAFFRE
jgi:hypothetical protein